MDHIYRYMSWFMSSHASDKLHSSNNEIIDLDSLIQHTRFHHLRFPLYFQKNHDDSLMLVHVTHLLLSNVTILLNILCW